MTSGPVGRIAAVGGQVEADRHVLGRGGGGGVGLGAGQALAPVAVVVGEPGFHGGDVAAEGGADHGHLDRGAQVLAAVPDLLAVVAFQRVLAALQGAAHGGHAVAVGDHDADHVAALVGDVVGLLAALALDRGCVGHWCGWSFPKRAR
jgi:hypothetical protein